MATLKNYTSRLQWVEKGEKGLTIAKEGNLLGFYKKTDLISFKKSTEVVEMARVNELNSRLVIKVAWRPKAAPDSNSRSWKLSRSFLLQLLFPGEDTVAPIATRTKVIPQQATSRKGCAAN